MLPILARKPSTLRVIVSIINYKRQESALVFLQAKGEDRESETLVSPRAYDRKTLASENCRGGVGGRGYWFDALAWHRLYLALHSYGFSF